MVPLLRYQLRVHIKKLAKTPKTLEIKKIGWTFSQSQIWAFRLLAV
jgi:hypothetical protein